MHTQAKSCKCLLGNTAETDLWKQGLKEIGRGRGGVRMKDAEQAFSRVKPEAKFKVFEQGGMMYGPMVYYSRNCTAPKLLSFPAAGRLLLG